MFWDEEDVKYLVWETTMLSAEQDYIFLIDSGATPEERIFVPKHPSPEAVVPPDKS